MQVVLNVARALKHGDPEKVLRMPYPLFLQTLRVLNAEQSARDAHQREEAQQAAMWARLREMGVSRG